MSVEKNGILTQWFKSFGLTLLGCGLISWLVVDHLLGSELSLDLVGSFAFVSVGISAKNSARKVCTRQNTPLIF